MSVIEISLPDGLLKEAKIFAMYNDTELETLIIWALAEKLGELKQGMLDREIRRKIEGKETSMQKYYPIKEVTPGHDFTLHLVFADGLEGNYDLKPSLARGGAFTFLADPEKFKTVKISGNGDYIEWDEDITIGADTLYAHIWLLEH